MRIGDTTHGMTRVGHVSPEYLAWRSMLNRCYLDTHISFPNYGGRGIGVCDKWRESFENFYSDMGPRPEGDYSLDRIDNDADYSPENCKWSTRVEQGNNRRTCKYLEHDGLTMSVSDWARKLGVDRDVLYWRLRSGWSVEDVLTRPFRKNRKLCAILQSSRPVKNNEN